MANEDEDPTRAFASAIAQRELSGDGSAAGLPAAPPVVAAAPEGAHRSPWLGRIIDDRYRVVELLAEGGMGTVFIAEHLKLRKMVALKTIHASFLGNPEVAAR